MPAFARFRSASRALTFAAWCAGASLPAAAQSSRGIAPRPASTLVVVLPAPSDSTPDARIARAVAGRDVAAVYTTDNPASYRAADAMHTDFGGSLIPYDRLARSANDVADLLFHNAVDNAARRHAGQVVLVVAEPDVTLALLRRATRRRAIGSEPDSATSNGFMIAIGPDGSRSVTRLP
jgi:hypothetical protein